MDDEDCLTAVAATVAAAAAAVDANYVGRNRRRSRIICTRTRSTYRINTTYLSTTEDGATSTTTSH